MKKISFMFQMIMIVVAGAMILYNFCQPLFLVLFILFFGAILILPPNPLTWVFALYLVVEFVDLDDSEIRTPIEVLVSAVRRNVKT